jgi:hypothetical protein
MTAESKEKAAERLIDEFAVQLLALNDGKAIPRTWKNQLLKAIKPLPAKRGRKQDCDTVVEAVKLLALSAGDARRPRTKHHNPATVKDQIAEAVGVSRKTIERIDADRPEFMGELERLDSLSPELRKAYIDGLSAAICVKLRAGDALEREAQEKAMRRRIRQMLPPDE